MSYHTLGTGIYDKEINLKTRTEFIEATLFDNDGNAYPASVEIEVNDFVVDVMSVMRSDDGSVLLNNQQEDITEAIRNAGYKSQDIKF